MKPDIHRPQINNFRFVKFKIGIINQPVLNNFLDIIIVKLDFALNKSFVFIVFDRKNRPHFQLSSFRWGKPEPPKVPASETLPGCRSHFN
ncbi:hypothetical protein, partial [Erwinia typographi]|uniref:hypothetical protein n=1 Tax=Erwinia typographi TaxID=371042 RepID=UPI001E2EB9D1